MSTDFSPQAMCAFRFATQLTEKSGARIVLLHVIEGSKFYSLSSTGEVLCDAIDNVFTLQLLEKSNYQLAELAARHANEAVAVHY